MSCAVVMLVGGAAGTVASWWLLATNLGESESWRRGLKLVVAAGGLATNEWGGEAASVAGTAAKTAASRGLMLTL